MSTLKHADIIDALTLERCHGLLDQRQSRDNENRAAFFSERSTDDLCGNAGFPAASWLLKNWAPMTRSKRFSHHLDRANLVIPKRAWLDDGHGK